MIPEPTPNGGLYTGAPFAGPWRNHPVAPDAGYYNFGSLRETPAPVAARYMVPGGGLRPGNNTPMLPPDYGGGSSTLANLNAICVPNAAYAESAAPTVPGDNPGLSFRRFAYLV